MLLASPETNFQGFHRLDGEGHLPVHPQHSFVYRLDGKKASLDANAVAVRLGMTHPAHGRTHKVRFSLINDLASRECCRLNSFPEQLRQKRPQAALSYAYSTVFFSRVTPSVLTLLKKQARNQVALLGRSVSVCQLTSFLPVNKKRIVIILSRLSAPERFIRQKSF